MNARSKWIGRILLLLAGLLLVAGAGFYVWATAIPSPLPEATRALTTDARVTVENEAWLAFEPAGRQPETGLVFYPGGRVDPRAYAPFAHEIAAQGYLVVITPMPLNLAVFGVEKAAEVMAAYPKIKRWAVGGHSLGGAMAAQFAYNHPDKVDGLVLWASYPANNASLAGRPLKVVSISGTRDGLATPDKIAASQALLPADTTYVYIKGGNHAQFGWYGPQAGDLEAKIGRADQQEQTVAATVALLAALAKK